MPSSSPALDASVTIPVEKLNELTAISLGVTPVTQTIQEKVGAVHTAAQPLVSSESQAETLDYKTLALEHAELIKQGKTSLEIATWMGDKLNIASWNSGAFYGERKVLSTPTEEEMTRLKAFTQALGISWTKANGGSDNHSQFLLLDGYIQNALFGQTNMTQVNERLDTFHTDWQNMWTDFVAKAKYLLEKVGLDIKWNWQKLTGIRSGNGGFYSSDVLYASGSLDGHFVPRMFLYQHGSVVRFDVASCARLCFLA